MSLIELNDASIAGQITPVFKYLDGNQVGWYAYNMARVLGTPPAGDSEPPLQIRYQASPYISFERDPAVSPVGLRTVLSPPLYLSANPSFPRSGQFTLTLGRYVVGGTEGFVNADIGPTSVIIMTPHTTGPGGPGGGITIAPYIWETVMTAQPGGAGWNCGGFIPRSSLTDSTLYNWVVLN